MATRKALSANSFGRLTRGSQLNLEASMIEQEIKHDRRDKLEFDIKPRKNVFWYKYEISKCCHQQKEAGISKALELLKEMKKDKRIELKKYNYTPIITACARAGHIKKAFDLYEEGLDHFKVPSPHMVTSLINACAQSSHQEYATKRLEWLEMSLKANFNYNYNFVNNKCRIKAYGKLGLKEKAFHVYQEILDSGQKPDSETYENLLFTCTQDKLSGLVGAIRIYKEMKLLGIPIGVNVYNQIVHCIRFCGIGSRELLEKTIHSLPAHSKNENEKKRSIFRTENDDNMARQFEYVTNHVKKDIELVSDEFSIKLPSLLDGNNLELAKRVVSIDASSLHKAWQRLKLLGGLRGLFETMHNDDVKPDISIFYHILTFLPPTAKNQIMIYHMYKKYSVDNDIVFYEMLLRNICHNSYDDTRLARAKWVIGQMQVENHRPSVRVFEMLAFACSQERDGHRLLRDIANSGLAITPQLVRNLFYSANYNQNLDYLIWLIKYCAKNSIQPTKSLVDRMEERKIKTRQHLLKTGEPAELTKQYRMFATLLKQWLSKVSIDNDSLKCP